MKFSEATNHAVSLVNILEESGASASDMVMVSNVFFSLVKARQSSELTEEIHQSMKSAMNKKRDELLNTIAAKKEKPKPIKINDLKVPKSKLN